MKFDHNHDRSNESSQGRLETGPGFSQKPTIFDLWYTTENFRLLKNFLVLKGSSGPELTPAAARARSFYFWIPGCCRPLD